MSIAKKEGKEQLLRLENISVNYGGVHALKDVSLSFDEGEIVALMGPNGAGKSTVLKAVFGLVKTVQGKVLWHEKEIKPVSYEVVKLGISFVPQGRRVFRYLTVKENLELGGITIKSKNILKERIEEVLDLFPDLKIKLNEKTGNLSGGQQQMVAIARGLITDPKLLLLDEPSLGLAPKIVKEVFEKIKEINEKRKMAIVIVEHNIKSILSITNRAYILDKGVLVHTGVGEEILKDNILEKVFLAKV
jgi:branched-chain amino acid transport system ATP-binding protein